MNESHPAKPSAPRVPPTLWPQVSALFDAALALPDAERAAWLQAQDAAHPEAAPYLRRLLAAHDTATTLAPVQPPLLAAALNDTRQGTLAAPQVGQRVGIYRLIEPLGAGGMASVWAAEQTQGVLRRVALKLPHAGLEAPAAMAARFEQERDLLAALEHPHIARLYDAGITSDGQPFLAMELIQGQLITTHAAMLPLAQRLQLFQQVLAAVSFAHGRLVIHRDIKPSNILVTAAGQVKLLDFGIARLLSQADVAPSGLSGLSAQAFTPDCAAPEQLAGKPLGAAFDVYALGVVLYELLTGRRPYKLDRQAARGMAEQLAAVRVRPPSSVGLQAGRTAAAELDAIVAQAMAQDAARRYPSAEALAADLQRHLDGQPVAAHPGGRAYVAGRFLRRHRLAVGAGVVVGLALSAGLAGALWQAERARLEAARAEATRDVLVGLFQANAFDQDDALRKRQQTVQQLLESSARQLEQRLAGQAELLLDLQGVVGGLMHELALGEPALQLREQRSRLLATRQAPSLQQAQAALDEAETLMLLGRMPQADTRLQAAIGLLGRDERPAARSLHAQVLGAQGQWRYSAGKAADAQPLLEQALALARQAPVDARVLAQTLGRLGRLRSVQARPAEAEAALREAIQVWPQAGSGATVGLAQAHLHLGEELCARRQCGAGLAEIRLALALLRDKAGPEHVQTALVELTLGRVSSVEGLPLQARPLLLHGLQVLQAHAADVSPARRVDALVFLGESMLDAGEVVAAGAPLAQAVALDAETSARADALPLLVLARQQVDTGQYDAALQTLAHARERRRLALGPEHPGVGSVDNRIALVYLAQGRLDEAERRFRALAETADARGANFGSVRDQARHNLRAVQQERGDFSGALAGSREAHNKVQAHPAAERNRYAEHAVNLRLGRVLDGLGRPAEARPYLERAAALAAEDQYPGSPRLATTRARLALCLLALGERGQAATLVAQAEAGLARQPGVAPHLQAVVQRARTALHAGRSENGR